MKEQTPTLTEQPEKNNSPEKWHWKTSYTLVLIANAVYIALFYLLMLENC
ncbi:hypothetical protein SAMN02927921_02688 [Sinomicrobium oceani]|uniref:Uncharacterized protein n=1 Tax=Sinomicrobium oceani TaxID=1150368 RepID=A0A1K1QMA6_9FLAO|nr:hypothetical protein [Sinomicrobium oceani]SFW61066.1 hypothetical protein SAMN02927921_02688 [Sinomicrobium oceani]